MYGVVCYDAIVHSQTALHSVTPLQDYVHVLIHL